MDLDHYSRKVGELQSRGGENQANPNFAKLQKNREKHQQTEVAFTTIRSELSAQRRKFGGAAHGYAHSRTPSW